MLVVDASAALGAAQLQDGFEVFRGERLVVPPLFWSEALSGVHEAKWRGDISAAQAEAVLRALEAAGIEERRHPRLLEEAWRTAEALGWAKTYDAEYVALAALLKCRLVTADGRLRRGADRLGFVIGPAEL